VCRARAAAIPAAPPLFSISWYAGALGLPWGSPTLGGKPFRAYFTGFDDAYPDDDRFEKQLDRLGAHIDVCQQEGQPFLTLMASHPQKIRLIDFVDPFFAPNGITYPKERWGMHGRPRRRSSKEVRTAIANFRRLARWIRNDSRLNPLTISEVAQRYGFQPNSITYEELADAAVTILGSDVIPLHPKFSPAELVCGFAQVFVNYGDSRKIPSAVPRQNVLGPASTPIWYPEAQACTYEQLIAFARQLLVHVKATGQLPATLGGTLNRVGVNHLYRAMAQAFQAIRSNSVPSEIHFFSSPPWPELAVQIGRRYLQAEESGLVSPDLDMNTVYRDAKLQTWTLKPATLRSAEIVA
jgi:hypothetical protein